jgi:hypothetical protein
MFIIKANQTKLNSSISLQMKNIIESYNLKLSLFFILFFTGNGLICAQNKFSLSGGWGYYERINIGAQWNFSNVSSLSLYGGSNFGLNDNTAWTAGLSFDQIFQKPIIWKLKPGYSLGLLYWTSDDDLYYFKNMSFPVMALLSYPISDKVYLRAEGGIIFTAVIQSDRKQNVEAGYPDRFNGNVKLSIIYKLGIK